MRSWKQQWKDELDAKIPELREDIKNAPIENPLAKTTANENSSRAFSVAWRLPSRKRLLACCASGLAALFVCVIALIAVLPKAKEGATEAIAVEINPRVVFTLDSDGEVKTVAAVNKDADVILSSDARREELLGKRIEDATQTFVDYAARLGYLDLSKQDAVRITSCGESEKLDDVGENLRTYFREKGAYAAVVKEKLSVKNFCQRVGAATASGVKKAIKNISELPKLYAERQATEKSVEVLQQQYASDVPLEDVRDYFQECLQIGTQQLTEQKQAIEEIFAYNEEICRHEDNPNRLSLRGWDYWSVEKTGFSGSGGAFVALMAKMRNAVANYEREYGVKMESTADLNKLFLQYASISMQPILELLTDFTTEVFMENLPLITGFLAEIGVDVQDLTSLCEVPATVEEYVEKNQRYANRCYNSRSEKHLATYEAAREAIGIEDYEAYEKGLIAQYGSLTAYWAQIKG